MRANMRKGVSEHDLHLLGEWHACTHNCGCALTPLAHSLAVVERRTELIVKPFADSCVICYKGVRRWKVRRILQNNHKSQLIKLDINIYFCFVRNKTVGLHSSVFSRGVN